MHFLKEWSFLYLVYKFGSLKHSRRCVLNGFSRPFFFAQPSVSSKIWSLFPSEIIVVRKWSVVANGSCYAGCDWSVIAISAARHFSFPSLSLSLILSIFRYSMLGSLLCVSCLSLFLYHFLAGIYELLPLIIIRMATGNERASHSKNTLNLLWERKQYGN